jgi:tRNA (mo5U34)-methyltransferase
MSTREHTRDELRTLFDSVRPWHHLIEVHGVPTKTEPAWGEELDHPRRLWEEVSGLLPDLKGKRVLDVGCNDGFFLFACRRLGAEQVVGVEAHEHFFNHAVLVNELLDLGGITVHQMSAYEVGEAFDEFDVTLALGLIYHLKSPFLFLERVAAITTSTIVVETAVRSSNEDRDNRRRGIASAPAMEFVENPPAELHPEGGANWWAPNTECVEAMLRVCGFPHTAVASEFILTPGPKRRPTEFGRAIVVGSKVVPPSESAATHGRRRPVLGRLPIGRRRHH